MPASVLDTHNMNTYDSIWYFHSVQSDDTVVIVNVKIKTNEIENESCITTRKICNSLHIRWCVFEFVYRNLSQFLWVIVFVYVIGDSLLYIYVAFMMCLLVYLWLCDDETRIVVVVTGFKINASDVNNNI